MVDGTDPDTRACVHAEKPSPQGPDGTAQGLWGPSQAGEGGLGKREPTFVCSGERQSTRQAEFSTDGTAHVLPLLSSQSGLRGMKCPQGNGAPATGSPFKFLSAGRGCFSAHRSEPRPLDPEKPFTRGTGALGRAGGGGPGVSPLPSLPGVRLPMRTQSQPPAWGAEVPAITSILVSNKTVTGSDGRRFQNCLAACKVVPRLHHSRESGHEQGLD